MPAPPTERCQYTTSIESDYFEPEEEPLLATSNGEWQCPHYALGSSDHPEKRCPFHPPPDQNASAVEPAHRTETVLRLVRGRECAGVGGTSLPEPLVTYLERTYESGAVTPGERTQLIGATLGGLRVDYQDLDAPVNAPLDLRKATITGQVSLSGATVGQEIEFSGTVFQDRVDCVETTFEGRAQFREATFEEMADFHHAEFDSWARFDDAEFDGVANFRGAEFDHGIFAPRVEFHAAADFMAAEFYAVAKFTEAVFKYGRLFSSTRLHRNGTFRGTEFRSPVVLSENFFDDTDVNKRWNRVTVADQEVPGAAVVFRNLTCQGTLKLTGAVVDGDVYVTSSRVHNGLRAAGLTVNAEAIEMNMAGTRTVSGTIETDRDTIQYDLTEATVGRWCRRPAG